MYNKLPIKIQGLIPHQPPMLVVDELISFSENEARTTTVFTPDSMFLNQDGLLDETVFFEMMAQTFAVLAVVRQASQLQLDENLGAVAPSKQPDFGYLVRVKRLVIYGRAEVGSQIETRIRSTSTVGAFSVLEGGVSQKGCLLASGQVTVFIPEGIRQ